MGALKSLGHDFHFRLTRIDGATQVHQVRLWGTGQAYLAGREAQDKKDGFNASPATVEDYRSANWSRRT